MHPTGTSKALATRLQSRGEEIANSVSHGMGLVAAIVAAPFLVLESARTGSAGFVVGVSIFMTTTVLLYLASTLYHALPHGRARQIFRVVEHSAIFLLIAGTYTPFTLGVLHGTWGWVLLGLVWGIAAAGIALKALGRMKHPLISTGLYVLMGWLILIAIEPLVSRVPAAGLWWLVTGGIAYTVGATFYLFDARLRYGHFIWHLFVLAGTTCHYFAVFWYGA